MNKARFSCDSAAILLEAEANLPNSAIGLIQGLALIRFTLARIGQLTIGLHDSGVDVGVLIEELRTIGVIRRLGDQLEKKDDEARQR